MQSYNNKSKLNMLLTICAFITILSQIVWSYTIEVRDSNTNSNTNSDNILQLPSNFFQRDTSAEEKHERDLRFRAYFCPDIPRDVLEFYRYYMLTNKCYPVGSQGPCGSNMIFVPMPLASAVGKCTCKVEENAENSRPMVYHPPSSNCHQVFSQGFCEPDEWVVISETNHQQNLLCQKNPCLELGTITENEVEPKEYILFNGTCVELGTTNSEHCNSHQIISFIGNQPSCKNITMLYNEILEL